MKIYFWIENVKDNIDLERVKMGNPGMGGTEFQMLLLVWYLSEQDEENSYALLSTTEIKPSAHCETYTVCNFEEALILYAQREADFFVLNYLRDEVQRNQLKKYKVNVIAWPSVFLYKNQLDYLADCEQVKWVVWVSRQHADRYLDHRIIWKSSYIYNGFYIPDVYKSLERKKSHIVTWVGGIYPQKGFHYLARIWQGVVRAVPDAELYVCGSGNLYQHTQLGSYGIAERDYEKTFMRYLIDENGKILPSVHFLGSVGADAMRELFKKTRVGVVNPKATTETFCCSAVEMELFGVPVVTARKKWGYLDTIPNGIGGLTANSLRGMKKNIVRLLREDDLNQRLGVSAEKYCSKMFNMEDVAGKWMQLFKSLKKGNCTSVLGHYDHVLCDLKWLRIINRTIQRKELREGASVEENVQNIKEQIKNVCLFVTKQRR